MTNYYAKLGAPELSGGLTLVVGTIAFGGAAATAQTLTLGLTNKLVGIRFSKKTSGEASGTGVPWCLGTLAVGGTTVVHRKAGTACTHWFEAIGY